jgi:hypothetical protein
VKQKASFILGSRDYILTHFDEFVRVKKYATRNGLTNEIAGIYCILLRVLGELKLQNM